MAAKNKITLEALDSGVRFTFINCDHYLYGSGTIDVPLNALSLVIDDSNMVTFKKAASDDVFISAPIDYFDMSKADLEEWYADNMVGGTGGGIDPETLAELVSSAEYVSSSSTIDFKNVDGDVISTINAEPFITDGMVDNVVISGSNLVITWNTSAGKQPISIPLTDIFNPSNYYDKTATDALLSGKQDTLQYYTEGEGNAVIEVPSANVGGVNGVFVYQDGVEIYADGYVSLLKIDTGGTATINGDAVATVPMLSGKADTSAVTAVADSLSGKQDTLLFYTENDNTQEGTKDGRIETTIEDTESGVTKTASVGSSVYLTPSANLNAYTEVSNSEESYQKSAEVSVETDGGVFLNYQTQDDIEQTNSDAQININGNGIILIVDNGEDIVNLNVTTDGVDIDGDPVVTESMLADSLSGKQDTLVYYSEDTENNEGRIGTSVEDGGVTKSSEVRVESDMDGDSTVSISAAEYSDDYDKEAVFYGTQDGIDISYYSADNVEGTSISHMINVNGDGFRVETNSDDGELTTTTEFSVTPEGATINGDEIVTESDLTASLSGKQDTLIAGSGITISGNVISADGGGGGMSEDDELLLATALVDLNDRKMDTADAKAEFAKYQKKGDYVTSGQLDTKLAAYETALDEQNVEEVTSYALNDLNERLTTVETALGGLSLSAITQSQWATISGSANPSTIYIITNNE